MQPEAQKFFNSGTSVINSSASVGAASQSSMPNVNEIQPDVTGRKLMQQFMSGKTLAWDQKSSRLPGNRKRFSSVAESTNIEPEIASGSSQLTLVSQAGEASNVLDKPIEFTRSARLLEKIVVAIQTVANTSASIQTGELKDAEIEPQKSVQPVCVQEEQFSSKTVSAEAMETEPVEKVMQVCGSLSKDADKLLLNVMSTGKIPSMDEIGKRVQVHVESKKYSNPSDVAYEVVKQFPQSTSQLIWVLAHGMSYTHTLI